MRPHAIGPLAVLIFFETHPLAQTQASFPTAHSACVG